MQGSASGSGSSSLDLQSTKLSIMVEKRVFSYSLSWKNCEEQEGYLAAGHVFSYDCLSDSFRHFGVLFTGGAEVLEG